MKKKILILCLLVGFVVHLNAQFIDKETKFENAVFSKAELSCNDDYSSFSGTSDQYTSITSSIPLTEFTSTSLPISNWNYIGPLGFPSKVGGASRSSSVAKGQIRSLYVDPDDPDLIYAGSYRGGLWKTEDKGNTWKCITSNKLFANGTSTIGLNGINTIAVDPINKNNMYIGVSAQEYYSTGVFRSTNGGDTWHYCNLFKHDGSLLFPIKEYYIYKILMDAENPSRIFVISGNQFKDGNYNIHRSDNYGVDWDLVYWEEDVSPKITEQDLASVYGDDGGLTFYASANKILYSTDNGLTFSDYNYLNSELERLLGYDAVLSIHMASHKNHTNLLWLAPRYKKNGVYYVSLLKFNQKTNQLDLLPGSTTTKQGSKTVIKVSPKDSNIIYVGRSCGNIVLYDTNGYRTLNCLCCSPCSGGYGCVNGPDNPNWIHTDIRSLEVLEGDIDNDGVLEDAVFTGNDGGVSINTKITSTGPWEWDNISDNEDNVVDDLNAIEFNSIAISELDPDLMVLGAQDSYFYRKDNNIWNQLGVGGDGGPVQINIANPTIFYLKVNGVIDRFFNKAQTGGGAEIFADGLTGNSFTEMHPKNSSIMYNGGYKLTKLSDINSLSVITTDITPTIIGEIAALAISPSEPEVMYVFSKHVFLNSETHHNVAFFSDDGGVTWSGLIENSLDNILEDIYDWTFVDAAVVHPLKPNELWIGAGGLSSRVCHSIDYGKSWTVLGTNYPTGAWVRDLAYDPAGNFLYAATDVGVWVYDEINETWLDYSSCSLPYCLVSEIRLNNKINKAYVSTLGHGAWSSNFKFCPNQSNIDVTGTNNDNLRFESEGYLKSTVNNSSASKVVYSASDYVVLHPGFESSKEFSAAVYESSCGSCASLKKAGSSEFNDVESIEEEIPLTFEENFKIYPNPGNGNFKINQIGLFFNYQLVVYNTQGKQLLSKSNLLGNTQIDISNFGKGVYIINILCDNNTYTKRLIVE